MEDSDQKKYLNKLLGYSGKLKRFSMSFEDENLEKIYLKRDQNNQLHKSKLFFILVTLVLSLCLISSLIINKQLTRNCYIMISGIVTEIIMLVICKRYYNHFNFFLICKYLRFFYFYVVLIVIITSSYYKLDEFSNLRMCYGVLLLINFVYIYIISFNYFFLILVPIINGCLLYMLKSIGFFGDINITLDIIVISIYYFCTFLIKKNEVLNKKESFLNSYLNNNYIEYTRNLIDVLNNMVISINKNETLSINNFTSEYLQKNKNNFIQISQLEKKKKKKEVKRSSLKSEENLIPNKMEEVIQSFFKSIFLIYTNESKSLSDKSLFDVIEDMFDDEIGESRNFERVGYFASNNSEFFDVFVRKLKFKEQIIEILIYDLTNIKEAEKKSIESKFKQKILAKIAHEFKTPLISIISLIDRIIKQKNERKVDLNRVLFHIDNLSNYVLSLISDLIQYVSESINLKIHKTQVNLKEVLDFSLNVLNTLIECNENKRNQIETLLNIDKCLTNLTIHTDENRLKQLLLNFISNAVKFTFSGLIEIKAKLKLNPSILQISIKDTGIGIKEDEKNMIFKENMQINLVNDYNIQGSGLGLSIAKSLADSLNFDVGFKSSPGKGSTFYIKIYDFSLRKSKFLLIIVNTIRTNPLRGVSSSIIRKDIKEEFIYEEIRSTPRLRNEVRVNTSMINLPKNIIMNESLLTPRIRYDYNKNLIIDELNGFKIETAVSLSFSMVSDKNNIIVIVDDHKLVRETTINLVTNVLRNLEMDDFQFIEASDGIDLLNIIKTDTKNKIKCIFLDENMEYVNGSEAVKIIRHLEAKKKIPSYNIVSTTAFDDVQTQKNIKDAGFNLILHKPCSKSTITEIINNLKSNK